MEFSRYTLLDLMYDAKRGESVNGLELVEDTGWYSGGKYEQREWIFKFEDHYYEVCDSREGSYHTDYYTYSCDFPEEVECDEVFPKEVTKIVWVRKEDSGA